MSDGRTGTAEAVQPCETLPRRRDREDVRAEIIAAAQRLIDRDGTAGFTLSAVAAEAELARATVYGHFSSRKELLAQLAPGDDASRSLEIAADEPEEDAAGGEAEESPPAAGGSPQTSDAMPGVESALIADAAPGGEDAPMPDAPPAAEAPATELRGGYDALMHAQAQALDQIARRVIAPKSMRREGTDVAISRVEARLSVAEQSAAVLEKSVGEKLKTVADNTAALAAVLDETRQRLERFEERQQAAIAQLRLDVHNLAHPGMPAPQAVQPEPELPFEPVEARVEQESSAGEQAAPVRPLGYLGNARLAAIQAAQQASVKPKSSRKKPLAKLWRRWRWPVVAVAAVIVACFDLYVFLHYQPASAAFAPRASATAMAQPGRHAVRTPEAQLARGLKLLNGAGIETNVEKAAVLIERAAKAGHPVAQNYMGVLYQTGTGVHANMATAIRWYEAAARAGNLKAMTNLGKAYAGGWTDGTDFTKAAEWFGRAAGFGDVDAEFDLAVLYERGAGVSRSVQDAYKWYMIAGAHGDENAAARAEVLAASLSPNQLLAAQAAAALFRPAKVDSAANDIPR